MTRIRFHRKLDDLKERLLVMAGMAEQAIQRAVEAYRVRDISLCDLVVRSEISINSFEREIDQMALDLLADRHGGAGDPASRGGVPCARHLPLRSGGPQRDFDQQLRARDRPDGA